MRVRRAAPPIPSASRSSGSLRPSRQRRKRARRRPCGRPAAAGEARELISGCVELRSGGDACGTPAEQGLSGRRGKARRRSRRSRVLGEPRAAPAGAEPASLDRPAVAPTRSRERGHVRSRRIERRGAARRARSRRAIRFDGDAASSSRSRDPSANGTTRDKKAAAETPTSARVRQIGHEFNPSRAERWNDIADDCVNPVARGQLLPLSRARRRGSMCPDAGAERRRVSAAGRTGMREMKKRAKFHGSMPALVTPFKDGEIDEPAFRALIDWQITSGSHGLVPVGTTGESPTLSHDEHRRVVDICIDEARGRVPVIAGAGSNNTVEAVALATPRRAGRRRRRPGRDPLLQQADAGRALPALQGRQRRDRHSDHHLQHPSPQRRRHVGRHDETAQRASQYRRRQGRDRRRRPRLAPATRYRVGLYPTFWRRHDGARRNGGGRPRLHFGHRQCRARNSAPN